ncbi:MAG: hypothetical protein D6820_14195 [Lentisphaerae bacterium]|nr:MAG: hypothetical protein D6820_14195 [Lentisphaerota bacterium]
MTINLFSLMAVTAGLLLAAGGWALDKMLPRYPDCWRELPRSLIPGVCIGAPVIIWAIYDGRTFLYDFIPACKPYLPVITILIIILAAWAVQYPFARAIGGLLTISMITLLHLGFTYNIPGRPLFALICYFFVVIGLFWLGSPWRFRDWLKKLCENAARRKRDSWIVIGNGILLAIIGVLAWI